MQNRFFLIFGMFLFALSPLVFSIAPLDELHLNIQTTDVSGNVETGTYLFTFNISTALDCSEIVYSKVDTLTTDARGVISYYLEDVNLTFEEQHWLCYYRDGELKSAFKMVKIPRAFSTDEIGFGLITGYTSLSYDGNISNGTLNGYTAANAICNAEYSGSHFCLKSEVLKTIASGNITFTGEVWFANGPPGYTAAANDCEGWTKVTSEIGPFWDWDENDGAGAGKLTPCSSELQLACCGGSS
jgi:hypothetical protein